MDSGIALQIAAAFLQFWIPAIAFLWSAWLIKRLIFD